MLDLLLGFVGGTAAVAGFHSTLVATRDLRVTNLDVPIADLPPALDGYTIAVIADLHHRPGMSLDLLRRAIDLTHEAKPDLIALLGDYGTSFRSGKRLNRLFYERSMREMGGELARLNARDGVVAVLGNHDHYYDAGKTRDWLRGIGITVLVNEGITFTRGGAMIAVGGVDDAFEGTIDPDGGLAGMPNDVPTIVLSHNPDGVLGLGPERRVDLVLSGHTHGGQVVVPGFGAPVTFSRVCERRTAAGWVPNARARLYVSRGAGSQIPLRFNCPLELPVLRLTR